MLRVLRYQKRSVCMRIITGLIHRYHCKTLNSSDKTMTKSELAEALSEQMDIPLKEAISIVSTILDAMTDTLVAGENIELRGFGSFTVRHYDSYTGRNPKTGKEVKIKPKKLPFFKVGKELREKVNAATP